MLLRGLSESMDSMRRFGSAMEEGLRARPDIDVRVSRAVPSPHSGPSPLGRLQRNLDEFARLPAAVRRARASRPDADIFHLTDSAHAHVIRLLPAARTVISCHDVRELRVREVEPLDARTDRLLSLRLQAHIRGLNSAAAVVCSSTESRRDIATLVGVPLRRIHVIAKGVGAEFTVLSPAERARLRTELYRAPHLVLSITSGNRWKNLPMIIRSVAALRRDGLDAVLVRAGAPLSAAHSQLAGELLGPAFHDVGRVSDRRLVELYNACDVLLFPSLLEGFGRPPVEAMSSGLPVVASSASPFAEVLGDAALLPDPHDERAVTEATRAALTDADLGARLRGRGLARAASYTWAATVAAYVELYRDVRSSASGPSTALSRSA